MDEGELKMNMKCDPEEAIELRERFPAVLPGYHMNKRYWNTVLIDGSVSDNIAQNLDRKFISVSVIETIQKRSEAFGRYDCPLLIR